MAFTRATGKHRRPSKVRRASAGAAGMAGLAAVGVVGTLASPASAASGAQDRVHDTGLNNIVGFGGHLTETVDEQAHVQATEAEQARAAAEAKEAAAKAKAEAKKKEAEAKRKAAAEKAKKERDAKLKAARAAEAKRAALGYVAPVDNPSVSTGYKQGGGMWSSGSHTGIDFHAGMNTPVKSVAAGEVVEAGNGGAYGNNIVIKHKDGTYTQYGHLNSIGVSVGQSVTSGEQIGLSGSTGNSSGPHLHFEARSGADYGSDMDPIGYLRSHGVKL